MRLFELLDDARMRKRVSRMREPDMRGWMATTLNSMESAFQQFEKDSAPAALEELYQSLRAAAALWEGLDQCTRSGPRG
jgi:hypothetical protein